MKGKGDCFFKNLRGWTLCFNLVENIYSLETPAFALRDIRVKGEIDGTESADLAWKANAKNEEECCFTAENALGSWRLVFKPVGDGLEITLSLQPALEAETIILIPMVIPELNADHLLVQGVKGGGCDSLLFPTERSGPFKSFFQTMLTREGRTLQISHPMTQTHLSSMEGELAKDGVRDLTVKSEATSGDWTNGVAAETVTLRVSDEPHELMTDWAERNADVKKDLPPAKIGWNSWDYYRWTISEDEVLENAEFIAADPVLSKHVKRIIIDDGWQYCYGEWEANSLFPSGMKSLADKLTRLGFEPGLWIAPTIIEPHCRIAQVEPDMLALGESGLPCLTYECMRRHGFVLDPTVDKTRQWMFDLFERYAAMGYKYFKLDFLSWTLEAPKFHDPSVPKGRIMGKILEPICDALKGKAEIMGCNYRFEAGPRWIDDARVSGDIHANWKAVSGNVHSIAGRFWSHDRLWRNDPDFALCRGPETSDDPDLHRLKPCLVYVPPKGDMPADPDYLNSSLVDNGYEQAKVLLSLVIVSGGIINLSDKMTRLNEKGLDLARKTVAAKPGFTGVPLDLFATERPSHWLQKLRDGGWRVLLNNWSDEEQAMSFDLRNRDIDAVSATDFWEGTEIAVDNGEINTTLRPRSCLLAEVLESRLSETKTL